MATCLFRREHLSRSLHAKVYVMIARKGACEGALEEWVMRRAVDALAAGAVLMVPLAAEARPGDRIGEAVVVVNQVTAELSRDVRTLATGDPVRHSELVVAGSNARTELKLDDNTKLALGPGARLRLDNFVYDPGKHSGSILVDLVTGTFRFMTGVATKPSYLVKTPTAAITVRGTIFDVFVRRSGETWMLLSEGGVEACTAGGDCRVLDKPGSILVITADGQVGTPSCWRRFGADLDFTFDEAFPFVAKPPSIDRTPAFTRASLTGNEVCAAPSRERRTDGAPPAPATRQAKLGPKPVRQAKAWPQPASQVSYLPDPAPRLRKRPPIKVVELPPIGYRPPVINLPRRPHRPVGDEAMPGYPGNHPGKRLGKLPPLTGKLPSGGYGKRLSLPTMPTKFPGKLPGSYSGKLPGSSPMKMPSMPSRIGGYGGGGSVLR